VTKRNIEVLNHTEAGSLYDSGFEKGNMSARNQNAKTSRRESRNNSMYIGSANVHV
jgi:hypothetical protein